MSVHALVTGGAGFLGQLVARRLLDGVAERVTLVDLAAPADELASDERVTVITGGLAELAPTLPAADLVIHLAAVVSSAAEADLDLGLRVNVDATRALLDAVRAWPAPPVLVFASSLAVFGRDPYDLESALEMATVDDGTMPRPQSSYGAQKVIGEQLVADYARRGLLRGRSVRLMTVTVRPGVPNAAASGFVSGIVREPLAGIRALCPVDPDTLLAVSSPRHTVDGLIAAALAADADWGSRTAMNLPGLVTTPREMAAALDRVAGAGTSDLIDWRVDAAVDQIVSSWPARFRTPRAEALGLTAPVSFDDVIREYLAR